MRRRIKFLVLRERKIAEQLRVNIRNLRLVTNEWGLSEVERNELLDYVGGFDFESADDLGKLHRLQAFGERDLGIEIERDQEKFAKDIMSVLFPTMELPF